LRKRQLAKVVSGIHLGNLVFGDYQPERHIVFLTVNFTQIREDFHAAIFVSCSTITVASGQL
jgi:hypothetical protein